MTTSLRRTCTASLVVVLLACGESDRPAAPTNVPRLGGNVVAVVGDHAIRRSDVEEEMARSGSSARAALDRLEERALLRIEATRGRTGATDVDVSRRALVQAVLVAVERSVGPRSDEASRAEARTAAVQRLVAELARRTGVTVREQTVRRTFGDEALFERMR